jgi:hypothetical protein
MKPLKNEIGAQLVNKIGRISPVSLDGRGRLALRVRGRTLVNGGENGNSKVREEICAQRSDLPRRVGGIDGGRYGGVEFNEDGLFSNVDGFEGTPSWGWCNMMKGKKE